MSFYAQYSLLVCDTLLVLYGNAFKSHIKSFNIGKATITAIRATASSVLIKRRVASLSSLKRKLIFNKRKSPFAF